MKSNEIEHAIHPGHVLKLKCSENPYTCDGCKELGLSRVSSASSTATSICMRNVQGLRLQGLLSTLFSRKVLFYSSRDQDAADTVRPVGGRWRDFNINTRVTQHAACIHAVWSFSTAWFKTVSSWNFTTRCRRNASNVVVRKFQQAMFRAGLMFPLVESARM